MFSKPIRKSRVFHPIVIEYTISPVEGCYRQPAINLNFRLGRSKTGRLATLDVACSLINGLIRSIEEIKKIGFNNLLDESKRTGKCLNISSEFKDKRKRKIPRKDTRGADDEGTVSDDNSLRIQCFQSLDSILTSLRWRFEKLSEIKSEFQFLTGNCLIMPSDEIKRWVNDLALKYEHDIDGPELFLEIEKFKFQASKLTCSFQSATQLDLLKCIHHYTLQDFYPKLEMALRIFLTILVTTATCEKSFQYVHSGVFKEEFLFCSPLATTTKVTDILEKVVSFFETENLSWNNLCGCCTDGTPAMMGSRSGIQVHVKKIEIKGDELDLVRNPFRLQVEKIPDEYQDEFLELKTDSSVKDIFDEKSLTEFWPLMVNSYPKVTEKALRALIPFVTTLSLKEISRNLKRKAQENLHLKPVKLLRTQLEPNDLNVLTTQDINAIRKSVYYICSKSLPKLPKSTEEAQYSLDKINITTLAVENFFIF
ncbi:hypothetical protein QTP88_019845 [Uroleucon formosanum]